MPEQPSASDEQTIIAARAEKVLLVAQVKRERRIAQARADYMSDLADAENAYARDIESGLLS